MSPDEIDLSAYPSYLGVRSDAANHDSAEPREAVLRGLAAALVVVLVSVMLGVVTWRLDFEIPVMGAVMSGGAVLAYARWAGFAPRRGLVPLLLLLLAGTALSILALSFSDAWVAYSILNSAFPGVMQVDRLGYIRIHVVRRDELLDYRVTLLQLLACATASGLLAAWWLQRKVRHRTER